MEDNSKYTAPPLFSERFRLRGIIETAIGASDYCPPLSMTNLSDISNRLIHEHQLDKAWKGWLMVELNNSIWKETLAAIPYEKRMLLLPQCLSNSNNCAAEIDELGLLCHRCNRCSIPNLQDTAERLGMMSLVAEGFTSVVGLIESGVINAVIGVSCLESLEKAFPLLINNAVPGIAVPLNDCGCKDTHVDLAYLEGLMTMHSPEHLNLLDYEGIKTTLKSWFSSTNLSTIFGASMDQTSTIALEWLSNDGKRWRPYLLASTYMALTGSSELPEKVQSAALAVEFFHKASLVHDDIQDNDDFRYGKQTVNSAHGIPIAINVGDFLLGEGYRVLSNCDSMELIKVAAAAHIALCKGQGMELEWSESPKELTMAFVLDIFYHKTVPAFDVALEFGVLCAGDDKPLREILHRYSKALGIAYQLQDDLEDFDTDSPIALRPSAVLAALCEHNPDESYMHQLSKCLDIKAFLSQTNQRKAHLKDAIEQVKKDRETYYQAAIASLDALQNIELKRLLYRVTARILT